MGYDEEELYALLGQWALGDGLGIRSRDLAQVVRKGREWFEDNSSALRDVICSDPRVIAARSDTNVGAMMDAAAIADLISLRFNGLPAAVAAVIIFHRGLDRLCSG